jgi:hypothetical protein
LKTKLPTSLRYQSQLTRRGARLSSLSSHAYRNFVVVGKTVNKDIKKVKRKKEDKKQERQLG